MNPAKEILGVAYGRASNFGNLVNTNGMRKDDSTIEAQRDRTQLYIEQLSIAKNEQYRIVEFIADEGFSGKNTRRPGFQKLETLIKSKKIKFIIATELSRLSRSVANFLELVRLCEENGVAIIIIGLNIDTSSPAGRVMVVIMVALAEFERQMCQQRVINNSLSRLLSDGKINGASEIIGLVKDPKRKGHFVLDPDGIAKLDTVLKLIIKFSSKKKILEAARELNLTGTKGRQMTMRMIDGVLENIGSRYRGKYTVDLADSYKGQTVIQTAERYITVDLPHGPVIDEDLLNQAQAKLDECKRHPIKAGKNGYIYLLSHLLEHEDGTKYQGQPGKNIRYYYNPHVKLRVQADDIDKVIIAEIKKLVADDDKFKSLVTESIKRSLPTLQKVESEIKTVQKSIIDLEDRNRQISDKLLSNDLTDELMTWLSEQITGIKKDLSFKSIELERLNTKRAALKDASGLHDIQKQIKKALQGFDGLTRFQQRSLLTKIISKVVIRSDNQLEVCFLNESSFFEGVTRRTPKLDSNLNGGVDGIMQTN